MPVEVLRQQALQERPRVGTGDGDDGHGGRERGHARLPHQPAGGRGRGEQRPRLVVALQVLELGVAVGHDPGAGLHARPVAPPHHRADRDRGVEVAGEVEVADDARVRAALHRLELVDDLHRPHLGRAAHGAGRERGAQHVDRAAAGGELARDLGREVHHVGVTLEGHQFVHLLGAERHDPADVVAGEVDEHHVLGPLLRVLAQLGGEVPVVLLGAAPEAGARDRPADDPPVGDLHHRLGRRADERRLVVAHDVHVRRRVHLPEHAVDVERVVGAFEVEALGEHDLEDVAGEDVLPRRLDRALVLRAAHRAS